MALAFNLPRKNYSDIWLTPPEIVRALGPFELDPCAAPEPRPWPTATTHFTEAEGDSLLRPWRGFVWLNPPYGRYTEPFLAKLAEHGHGLALVFARTETRYFFEQVWEKASGLYFLKGRIKFFRPDGLSAGNAPAPNVLISYGDEALRRLANIKLAGHLVVLRRNK